MEHQVTSLFNISDDYHDGDEMFVYHVGDEEMPNAIGHVGCIDGSFHSCASPSASDCWAGVGGGGSVAREAERLRLLDARSLDLRRRF